MTDRGKYVMSRGWQNHPFFKKEPFTEREVWEWLIGEAAYEAARVRVNRKQFDLNRGQLVHAIRFMAERWQWQEARVRRFLERLRLEAMIGVSATHDATTITICNYDQFQFGTQASDAPNDEPATNQRRREEEPKKVGEEGSTPARATNVPLVSKEALALANEIAIIAGHDVEFLPPKWVGDGPGYRVQMMLNSGWRPEVMLENARAAMRKKRDGPPSTIRYFEPIFARAHAPHLPLPTAKLVHAKDHPHATTRSNREPWQSRNDSQHDALDRLRDFVTEATNGGGDSSGSGSEPTLRLVSNARHGKG